MKVYYAEGNDCATVQCRVKPEPEITKNSVIKMGEQYRIDSTSVIICTTTAYTRVYVIYSNMLCDIL